MREREKGDLAASGDPPHGGAIDAAWKLAGDIGLRDFDTQKSKEKRGEVEKLTANLSRSLVRAEKE